MLCVFEAICAAGKTTGGSKAGQRSTLFSSFCISCFEILGFADPGGIVPHRVSSFLEIVNEHAFHMKTNQFRTHTYSHFLYHALYMRPLLSMP